MFVLHIFPQYYTSYSSVKFLRVCALSDNSVSPTFLENSLIFCCYRFVSIALSYLIVEDYKIAFDHFCYEFLLIV
jgi:hypothetical protein